MSLANLLNRQYAVITRSEDGDSCKVVHDRDIGTYLHSQLCACDALAIACGDESVQAMMKRLPEPDEWNGDCFEFEIPFLDGGSIMLYRMDERAEGVTHPLEIAWEACDGQSFNPEFSGYTAAHYCTGNPELGWCLYSRGAGGCWNQRTKRQYAFRPGWEPKQIAGGRWFWACPNPTPEGSVLTDYANLNN